MTIHNTFPFQMNMKPCLLLLLTLSMTVAMPIDEPTFVSSHHLTLENGAETYGAETYGAENLDTYGLGDDDEHGNEYLVKSIKKIFNSPPKAAPAPKPKAAPAPKPKAAPAPKPKAEPEPKAVSPAPVSVVIAPKPAVSQPGFPIAMTCDNEFDLYVAGKKVGKGDTWTTTYEFSPIVKTGDVIAIDGVDKGGPAAFIGVFNGKVTKPADWKCTTSKFSNWNENSFDDSAWPRAVSYSRNQDNNVWRSVSGGSRPKIPADAEWLWTSNNENHDRVFCRYTPIKAETPKVEAPKVVVAPKVEAPTNPNVGVSSASSSASKSLSDSKDDVIGNVNNMHTRIVSIIHETQTLQKREIEQNKKNVNFSQTDLDKFMMKQDDEQNQLQRLHASIIKTNQSIARHYAQMNADSLYLQKLDLIKPQFLQTLDATNANFAALSGHVSKLANDEHKKFMQAILSRSQNQTVYDTRDLAQAFLAHYEKYKHVLRADSDAYNQDLSNLKDLNQKYASGQTVFSGLKAEVARLRDLLASLKKTVSASEAEAELFVQIEKLISSILSSKKTKFAIDGANKECAVSVLKSHVANGLI